MTALDKSFSLMVSLPVISCLTSTSLLFSRVRNLFLTITIEDKWNKIIETQKKVMDVWVGSHPTLQGKELILKALVTSRSWFLVAVNGMPDHIEKEMTRIMKDFIWDGNQRGLMRLHCTAKAREKGGLG